MLTARAQGMNCSRIAEALSDVIDEFVDPATVRMFCHRRGVSRRLGRWRVPEGYIVEYEKLRDAVGVEQARVLIERQVERDRQRRAA